MTDDWIDMSSEALDCAGALAFVSDQQAGGVAIFLGTSRAETNTAGRTLLALDYEAYPQMALEQMRELAVEARKKWPITKLAMLHRTGRVGLAEPSVIIAVSSPHRAEAFDACRWLIDELKKSVGIWKKEIWADGSATWKSESA
ncbi:MAG TPA: molybdenum cofactor biosynthesis protein MoaE [Humisphaera sp.]|jgi:molybdopterin synthase catalytic subunit|nr:molybdenum cofactor biosynthesis protein MoaE [Humisphaera sp.]